MKGIERTVEEAREAAKAEPERWRAALTWDTKAPQTLNAVARLYATIKGAEEDFRELVKSFEAEGFKRYQGGISKDGIWMKRGDEVRTAFLQKRSARAE